MTIRIDKVDYLLDNSSRYFIYLNETFIQGYDSLEQAQYIASKIISNDGLTEIKTTVFTQVFNLINPF